MTCQQTMTLGVYLLGALDPAERSAFESHLAYCATCRGELVRLAPLPGLLNQIAPEDFADSLPSATAEPMGAVATRAQPVTEPVPLPQHVPQPRAGDQHEPPTRPGNKPNGRSGGRPPSSRRLWRVAAVFVAVVALAAGGIFGWQALRHSTDTTQADGVVWTGKSADGAATVEARLIDREWGTEFQMTFHGMPPDRECYLVVFDHYGNRQIAGWWGTDHDANDVIPGSVSIRRSKIERLEFLLDDKKTVALTIEAPG
ncbi:anti-sigma factor family protein [Actinophytocola oryzae]|uniref:Putative zinc finger protein n=1 Tax=Actinophytocola oryzae TaxID=502181 RepID=A0A4R7UT43_9PSEU|nr:zf-HC2 domain-containing protein [Actinophytocola oryzae]TDV39793.1 putative zinc finger protein [Actinophytocola oryzae]